MGSKYDSYNQAHEVQVALTVKEAAYTQGDVVGGLITVTKVVAPNWHGCTLRSVSLMDAGAQSNPFTLYLFNQLPSTIADDAAWTPLIADLLMMPAGHKGIVINAGDYDTITTSDESTVTVATKQDLNVDLDLRGGTASTFYAYLVDGATLDAVATDDFTIKFVFWID